MSEHGPDWGTLGDQAAADQARMAVRPFATAVAAFYHALRAQGVPRDVAAGLTESWMRCQVALGVSPRREQ